MAPLPNAIVVSQTVAQMWGVPFEYNFVLAPFESVSPNILPIEEGEAIAVNCALRLSQLLDELPPGTSTSAPLSSGAAAAVSSMGIIVGGVGVQDGKDLQNGAISEIAKEREGDREEIEPPRTAVLRVIMELSPKIVTVVEQQSNVGSPFFLTRFYEALYYYATLFESIDASLPKNEAARRMFEEQVSLEGKPLSGKLWVGFSAIDDGD